MPNLLKLYSEACGLRHTRPSAPVLPCTPDISRCPQQPTARHRLYRRRHPLGRIDYLHSRRQDIRAFPPCVRVRVARSCPFQKWSRSGNFIPQRSVTAGGARLGGVQLSQSLSFGKEKVSYPAHRLRASGVAAPSHSVWQASTRCWQHTSLIGIATKPQRYGRTAIWQALEVWMAWYHQRRFV